MVIAVFYFAEGGNDEVHATSEAEQNNEDPKSKEIIQFMFQVTKKLHELDRKSLKPKLLPNTL